MRARIYRPSRTATQSGRALLGKWVLEYEVQTPRRPEPLMGWVASGDTLNQVRLQFDRKEDAVAFARRKGLVFEVEPERRRRVQPRNYADNFRQRPR